MKSANRIACATAILLALSAGVRAQPAAAPQMPDARQMSGVPLPVNDLATGTVTVRVVRGSMTNVVAGQSVELTAGASSRSATTNDAGRAEFTGLTPGTRIKASTVVDGERLESQEFSVPATGGVRVALVATAASTPGSGAPSQGAQVPAQTGAVVLGERSRFVFEMGDEALNVFALLDIVNSASGPVQPSSPVVFDLPDAALGAGTLDGSSSQAVVAGKQVRVSGPFAPGSTLVQFAYSLPISGASLTFEQRLPIRLAQLSVMAQKVGPMELHSPQIAEHRDMPLQGETFIVAKGPAVPAGQTVSLTLNGLPHHAVWPRNLALALAALILAGGVWGSRRGGKAVSLEQARRGRLEARRDKLFAELTALEDQHRRQAVAPERYARRRAELTAALERVFAEIDGEAAA
jgi:hypothetical protein